MMASRVRSVVADMMASSTFSGARQGKGMSVVCRSKTLTENRELLATVHDRARAAPDDKALQAELESLQTAVAAQMRLQSNIHVPGVVERIGKRAEHLHVKPVLDSDGNSFELSFGVRKAKFTLNDGTVLEKHIEHAIGSFERPMTRDALEIKFADQAATALPMAQVQDVMALCWDVEALDDVSAIAEASVPA